MKRILTLTLLCFLLHSSTFGQLGIFEKSTDVGPVLHQGATNFDLKTGRYELSGAGANIWYTKDEFHFTHKKLTGDFILQCRGKLLGKGVDPHRKFGWMVRTDLDTTAAMVSATVHGDGTAAIQYRKKAGTRIEQVKSPVVSPDVIQLERRGSSYFLSLARFGEPFWTVEVPELNFPQELLAGLFICSHNKDVVERAEFDNVRIYIPAKPDFTPYRDYIGSHIEIMDLASGDRNIIHSAPNSLQAPNWLPDDKGLIYNSEGLIYKLDFASGKTAVLNTDFVTRNNNDHVISFDGKMLGLSSSSGEQEYGSLIYTVPLTGGKPKRITPTGPSYLHSWSPDGKWLTYTARRNDNWDIYRVPSDGGDEVRLTTAPGLEDSPEYSPDGQWIYFNSTRTGSMDLWRMRPDGSFQEPFTDDEYQDWFPHFSPDGKWIVFISFLPDVKLDDHPFYRHVYLRMMPAAGGKPRIIGYLYGGQGTINTPSWSPDGKKIAFVSNSTM